eukprot:340434-Prymnesium_polylepis.1
MAPSSTWGCCLSPRLCDRGRVRRLWPGSGKDGHPVLHVAATVLGCTRTQCIEPSIVSTLGAGAQYNL